MTKKLSRVVRCLALLLTASLLIGLALPAASSVEVNEKLAAAEDELAANGKFDKQIESDTMAFYIQTSSGMFALVNKNTGAIWYSNPLPDKLKEQGYKATGRMELSSQIHLQCINVLDINTNLEFEPNYVYSTGGGNEVTVSKKGDTVKVLYDFVEKDIKIPVLYSFKDDCFEASIDVKNIDEGKTNRIMNIRFLPFFGAASREENGYHFVPDGCGAVAEYNSMIDPYVDYTKTIYGEDSANLGETATGNEEQIRFPVFGTVVEGKGAMMGVITSGDGSVRLNVNSSYGEKKDKFYYNYISTQMAYRIGKTDQSLFTTKNNGEKRIYTLTNAPYGLDKYTIRYYFLDGEKANYSGMAETYRDYLIKEKGLKKNASKASLALQIYGALETKANFLGITYQKDQKLTSFEETQDILASLKKAGINDISVQYIGWTNDGVYNRDYPTSAKPLSSLGGKSDFNDLKSYMDEQDIEYYMSIDLTTFSKGKLGVGVKANSTKTTNGNDAQLFEYSVVTGERNREVAAWYLLRPQDLQKKSKRFFKSYSKLGMDSIAIQSIGDTIYSDFSKKDGVFRSKSIEYFEEFISGVNKDIKNVAITGGNSYAVPYATRIFDAPMTSSQYEIFTYDVPFFQMVLHGYVNYTTAPVVQSVNRNTTLLKSIENGSDLLFACTGDDAYVLRETRLTSLYSSKFSIWKDSAVDFYAKSSAVNSKVWDQTIVFHEKIGDDFFKTVYSNGLEVYVNYSETEQVFDGITVKAQDYAVKEAK